MISFIEVIFYAYSSLLIVAALGVVIARNPVHSAMFLVLSFVSCAALWLLLEAEFLAIALVLVYVGAVMVLFLFVVMMLDVNMVKMREGFVRYLPVGILVALIMIGQMIWVVGDVSLTVGDTDLIVAPDVFSGEQLQQSVRHGADYSNTKELGRILYTDYVLPFEIAAVILLVAIIAAISLTLRRRPMTTKYQTPGKQIKVKREDRLRIVKMDPEPKEPIK